MATDEKARWILSYGGGVNTTALMIYLVENKMPIDEAVFADTGGEIPETYSYLSIAREYLKNHGIPLKIIHVSVGGTGLYECATRRRVIPSQVWRWCTRDFKIRPIYRYYKSLGVHINQYIGIDYGEVHRIKDSQEDFVSNHYPLVDAKIDRKGCIDIIKLEGLPVPPKSGCYFCPFNNHARWQYILENHPNLYNKALKLEENSKHFPKQKLNSYMLRELRPKLIEMNLTLQEDDSSLNMCGGHCML